MLDKDMMNQIAGEFNTLSEEEKARRAQSLQRLLDNELQRRQQQRPAQESRLNRFLRKLFFLD